MYGLGIGEKTAAWSYSLPDGTNTPRQLSNSTGVITLASRYTPWGDSLDTYSTGNFTFGYFGGVMDAATGLLYVGNGQYYDPTTGRFLTRDAKPNQPNPYVPWDPTGAIIGPLGLMALLFVKRKMGSKWGIWLVLLLVVMTVGMTLAACGPGGTPTSPPPQPKATATAVPTATSTPVPHGAEIQVEPGTTPYVAPSGTPSPSVTVTAGDCATPIGTPGSIPPPMNPTEQQKRDYIGSFGIVLEGNWTGVYLENLWEALFTYIGYMDLPKWLNGRTATVKIAGSSACAPQIKACYNGETPATTLNLYATNTVNPVINMLHEFGHLVDNLWYDYFTGELEDTTFTLNGEYLAGWDDEKYRSLPASVKRDGNDVRVLALRSTTFGGQDAWQQRGGTPTWEDWADIFSNSMIHNVNSTTDLGGQMDSFFIRMKNHVSGG